MSPLRSVLNAAKRNCGDYLAPVPPSSLKAQDFMRPTIGVNPTKKEPRQTRRPLRLPIAVKMANPLKLIQLPKQVRKRASVGEKVPSPKLECPMIRVHCPICQKKMHGQTTSEWPDYPFCSPRCRLIDLGRWLKEDYRLPAEDDNFPEDSDNSTYPT